MVGNVDDNNKDVQDTRDNGKIVSMPIYERAKYVYQANTQGQPPHDIKIT